METPSSRSGSVTLIFCALLLIFMCFGLGMLSVSMHWTRYTEEQITMDRCVGRAALQAKRTIKRIEVLNARMEDTRKAMLVAIHPAAIEQLQIVLRSLALLQDGQKFLWNLRLTNWQLPAFCDSYLSSAQSVPRFPFERPPADLLGPKPMILTGTTLSFRRTSSHRRSHARLSYERNGWNAKWTNFDELPKVRTSFD